MRCFYCGKRVSLVRKRSDTDFCSDEHRRLYHARTLRSMDRLLEAEERLSVSRRLNEGFSLRPALAPRPGIPPERLLRLDAGRLLAFSPPPARLPVSHAAPRARVEEGGRIAAAPPLHDPAASGPVAESPKWLAGARPGVTPGPFQIAPGNAPARAGLAGWHQPLRDIARDTRTCPAPELDRWKRDIPYPEARRSASGPAIPEPAAAARSRQPLHAPPPAAPALDKTVPIRVRLRPVRRQRPLPGAGVPAGSALGSQPKSVRPPARNPAMERLDRYPSRPVRPEVRISVPALAGAGATAIPKATSPRSLPCRQRQYPWESFAAAPAPPRFRTRASGRAWRVPEAALRVEPARAWTKAVDERAAPESFPAGEFHRGAFPLAPPRPRRSAQGLPFGSPVQQKAVATGDQPRGCQVAGWEARGDSAWQPLFRSAPRQVRTEWRAAMGDLLRAPAPPEARDPARPRACQAAFAPRATEYPGRQRISDAALARVAPPATLAAPYYEPLSAAPRLLRTGIRPMPVFPALRRPMPVLTQAQAEPRPSPPKPGSAQPCAAPARQFKPDAAFRHPKPGAGFAGERTLSAGPALPEQAAARNAACANKICAWAPLERLAPGTFTLQVKRAPAGGARPSISQLELLALAVPAFAPPPLTLAAPETWVPLAAPGLAWPATAERFTPRLTNSAWMGLRGPAPGNLESRVREESIPLTPSSVLPGASRLAEREWGRVPAPPPVEPFYEDFANGLENWDGDLSGWQQDIAGVRPGALALLRPSVALRDYRCEFLGRIESHGIACAVRAVDGANYYAVKIEAAQDGASGSLTLVRYAVVDGNAEQPVRTPLSPRASGHAPSKVQVVVEGNDFTLFLDGKPADSWSEERLPAGGIGFFRDGDARARLYWVKILPVGESPAAEFAPLASVRPDLNFEMTMGV